MTRVIELSDYAREVVDGARARGHRRRAVPSRVRGRPAGDLDRAERPGRGSRRQRAGPPDDQGRIAAARPAGLVRPVGDRRVRRQRRSRAPEPVARRREPAHRRARPLRPDRRGRGVRAPACSRRCPRWSRSARRAWPATSGWCRRTGPGSYQVWGRENREAALRLVTGSTGEHDIRANLEVKCFDLAANPYLVVGSLLAAGLAGHGLAARRDRRRPGRARRGRAGQPRHRPAAAVADRGGRRVRGQRHAARGDGRAAVRGDTRGAPGRDRAVRRTSARTTWSRALAGDGDARRRAAAARIADLTPAERKVARVLLADYPVRGLEPIAKLAARPGCQRSDRDPAGQQARASTATPDFQQALKSEVSARLSSPLSMYPERSAGCRLDALSRSERVLCDGIASSFARLPRAEFDQAVRLLADPKRGVTLIGGRFSSMLAEYLAAHLRILRPNVRVVTSGADRVSAMLDVGRRDVLVAFDYRRYQHDTVRLAMIAKRQGADADRVHRPVPVAAGRHADVILTTSVASPSPFDALTPARRAGRDRRRGAGRPARRGAAGHGWRATTRCSQELETRGRTREHRLRLIDNHVHGVVTEDLDRADFESLLAEGRVRRARCSTRSLGSRSGGGAPRAGPGAVRAGRGVPAAAG